MIDVSELNSLAVEFDVHLAKVIPKVGAVVMKGAGNIQREARQLISGLAHAPHYPRSITFDIKGTLTSVEAEIGPDKGLAQGALGNILEYGTSNNPPHAHLGPALDREGPRFVTALDVLARPLS